MAFESVLKRTHEEHYPGLVCVGGGCNEFSPSVCFLGHTDDRLCTQGRSTQETSLGQRGRVLPAGEIHLGREPPVQTLWSDLCTELKFIEKGKSGFPVTSLGFGIGSLPSGPA